MKLYHITDPAIAEKLIVERIFIPGGKGEFNNDNGMNLFSFKAGYRKSQYFEHEGVKLIVKWERNCVIKTHQNTSPPLKGNVLHYQYPWRCFVRDNGENKNLRVLGVLPQDDEIFDSFLTNQKSKIVKYPFLRTLNIEEKRKFYLKSVYDFCKTNPVYIQVAKT